MEALSSDLLDGSLVVGARLPAHRDLAYQLGVSVGSVTRAYATLERRGLVRSVRGSGMFAAVAETRRGPLIDMSENVPPAVLKDRVLARTLTSVAKRLDIGLFQSYPPLGGFGEHRRQMSRWFAGLGVDVDPERLLLTVGAQHALAVAFSTACGRDGTLYVEAQTYSRALCLARHLGIRVAALSMDEEGMLPAALDSALGRHGDGPAVVYVTPTMQNPTTATMARRRREDIVRVCRAHDASIVEDDVYTLGLDPDLPALATLAPERTLYANSVSKTVNPSLRIGALALPDRWVEPARRVLADTSLMVSTMACAVMGHMFSDGTAEAIRQAVHEEVRRRAKLARSILGKAVAPARQDGHHVWLPMSRDAAQQCDLAARSLGVLVTPPASTAADPEVGTFGVRLCIGAPTLDDLPKGLAAVAGIVAQLRDPTSRELPPV